MGVDAETFRQALAAWPSGVTIVTSRDGDHVHGMTVSAFCSVSLDPPLVLVCADKASNTLRLIERSKAFSVSILSSAHQELSNRFASKRQEQSRFEGLVCRDGETGCPHIPGAIAALDCRVVNSVDAGDHVVCFGSVEGVVLQEGDDPLLYYHARYRALAD